MEINDMYEIVDLLEKLMDSALVEQIWIKYIGKLPNVSILNESKTVARLSEQLSRDMGYSIKMSRQIGIAAALHDAGKMLLAPEIVYKQSKLTPKEFEVIKTHTWLGANMLSNVHDDTNKLIQNVCLLHHEKWNGEGYMGIPSCCLPEYISIVAIVDVFVAALSKRSYKEAWTLDTALGHIQQLSGSHFSHELVKTFLRFISGNKQLQFLIAG